MKRYYNIKDNIKSIIYAAFKQLTELGSLTIVSVIIIFSYFYDQTLAYDMLIGVVAVTIISLLIKALTYKERPTKQKFSNLIERIDASSFPSVHSARIAIVAFWLSVYSDALILKIFIISIAVLVAYSRIYLKKHYYVDVIAGIVLAGIIDVLIYLYI